MLENDTFLLKRWYFESYESGNWSYVHVPYSAAISVSLIMKLRNQCILSFSIKSIPLPELAQRQSVLFLLVSWQYKLSLNFTMVENWNKIHLIKDIVYLFQHLTLEVVLEWCSGKLQSWAMYLRQTLVFMWNSALREKFHFCSSEFFAS